MLDAPMMRIVCTAISLPLIRDPQIWEEHLAAALGSPILIRWWISRVQGDRVTVEAVIGVGDPLLSQE